MNSDSELLDKVYKSLKWKQSDHKSAKRLGIDILKYRELKQLAISNKVKSNPNVSTSKVDTSHPGVFDYKYAIEKGQAEYKAISTEEPKTSEDIEKLLNLDTTKWRLSSYWNKQQSNGNWLISANVSQIKLTQAETVRSVFDSIKLEYIPEVDPTTQVFINSVHEEDTCAVLSLQDIHIGKENLDGSGPEDIVESVRKCVKSLIMRSYYSSKLDKIIFVLGGDLINMDTYSGTTTGGTPVDNNTDSYNAYKIAFDLMFWCVNYLKQYCKELEVVYIPGNHSRLSEAHIAYALSKSIIDPNITWNVDYAERKAISYGNSMICVEHGDFNTNRSFFVFATEFAKQWGEATNRTLYIGHTHKEKKVEYITTDEVNGFTIKVLPSLTKVDKYHYQNKWTNNRRGGIIELHSKTKGVTGTFQYFE